MGLPDFNVGGTRSIMAKYLSLEPMHQQGLSWEEMHSRTGIPMWQIQNYAKKNFPGYGVRQNTPRAENKPVAHTEDTSDQSAPALNYGGHGYGRGGGVNTRERDYTIGQIDEALGEYDHQLGMLDEQGRVGRRDIEDGYNRDRSRLNTQHSRAMSRFATQEDDNRRAFRLYQHLNC